MQTENVNGIVVGSFLDVYEYRYNGKTADRRLFRSDAEAFDFWNFDKKLADAKLLMHIPPSILNISKAQS